MDRRQDIIDRIDTLFGDTRVPVSSTKEHLEYIAEHLSGLIETLDEEEPE